MDFELQMTKYYIAHAQTSQKIILGFIANIFIMSLDFCTRWIYKSDKFIHATTQICNNVMRLLKLAGVIKCE